jgi:hypothetical protein
MGVCHRYRKTSQTKTGQIINIISDVADLLRLQALPSNQVFKMLSLPADPSQAKPDPESARSMVYGWTAAGRQKRDLDTCVHQQADTHSINNREVLIFFSAVVNSDNSVRQGPVHIADD